MIFSNATTLEVVAHSVSKAQALEVILKEKGILPKDVMAFGDGMNDLEMLQYVGRPVVMANAADELKSLMSDAQVTWSNVEDGVARYLVERVVL